MVSYEAAPFTGHASMTEDSLHPFTVSDLLDGDLSIDELNEIPSLLGVGDYQYETDVYAAESLLEENHPATQIALTASAIDGALGSFEFLATDSRRMTTAPVGVNRGGTVSDDSEDSGSEGKTSKKRVDGKKSSQRPNKKPRTSKPKKCGSALVKMVDANEQFSPLSGSRFETMELLPLVSPSPSVFELAAECSTVDPVSQCPGLPGFTMSSVTEKRPLLPRPLSVVGTQPNQNADFSESEATSRSLSPTSIRATFQEDFVGPVNTSSEHIRLLTGVNGPVECAKVIPCTITSGSRSGKHRLSAAEKAQASRDRNREHARNTRLRKKAYVEELKRTLEALAEERDANRLDEERRAAMKEEQRNVRFHVLVELLRLQGGNCQEARRWEAILVPGFTLRVPVIGLAGDAVEDMSFVGVDQAMENACSLSDFLQTLGGSSGTSVVLQFDTENSSSLIMDGSNAVLDWEATTVGAKGLKEELRFYGTIKARFDPESNKLASASMFFDTGLVLSQRKKLAASY